MRAKYLLAAPVVAMLIGASCATATAVPTTTDPWATLPGVAPQPRSMVTVDGNLFVANSQTDTVTKILPNGHIDTTFNASLPTGADPVGIAADSAGNLYTADAGSYAVSKITPAGVVTAAYASLAAINAPEAITVDPSGNVFTANNDSTVSLITPSGTLTANYADLGNVGPTAIVSDPHGTLYTVNQGDGTIGRIVQGSPVRITPAYVSLGTGLPSAIALTADGNAAFVTNQNADTVSKLDLSGVGTGTVSATYTLPAGSMAQGVAVDVSGNAYTTDFGLATLSMIVAGQASGTPAVTIQTLTDLGADPEAIAVDPSGRLFSAGFNSGTISKLELAPAITSSTSPVSISAGDPFSYTATASGVDPLSFALSGTIPGLTFNTSTGVLSGIPTVPGTYNLSLTAINPFGPSTSAAITITVTAAPDGGTGTGAGTGTTGTTHTTSPGHLPTVAG